MVSAVRIALSLLALGAAAAYDEAAREAANEAVKSYGFPALEAFNRMTPAMLQTVLKTYVATVSPGERCACVTRSNCARSVNAI